MTTLQGYEPAHLLPPEERGRIQLWPALGADFLAGFVLLIAPRGTPWCRGRPWRSFAGGDGARAAYRGLLKRKPVAANAS